MSQVRILAVLPNEGLSKVLSEASKLRDDLSITVIIGNLSAGLAMCNAVDPSTYDLILSRGGTARLLAQHVNKPVVEIRTTIYDLLRVIRLVSSYSRHMALVGFSNMTSCMDEITDMLSTNLKIVTITSEESVHDIILGLRRDGYTVVIGDTIAVSEAKSQQMNGILIPSGVESVTAALDEAVSMFSTLEKKTQKELLLNSVLSQQGIEYMLFDAQKQLILSRCSSFLIDCLNDIRSVCDYVQSASLLSVIRRLSGHTYRITISAQDYMGKPCTLVSFCEKKGIWNDAALTYQYKQPSDIQYYDNVGRTQALQKAFADAAPLKTGILLLAEEGVDLSTLLDTLHTNSAYNKESPVRIDFRYLRESALQALLHKETSPFSENHRVLFLDNVEYLSDAQQRELIEFISASLLFKRNKGVVRVSQAHCNCPLCSYLLSEQFFTVFRVPPLCERREDIPTIATQLISLYNYEYSKQIIGFDHGALHLITQYDWPENSIQLYRVIRKLVGCTEGSRITNETVRAVLDEENLSCTSVYDSLSTYGTLDEITYAVVLRVLKEEKMNKTKAAERLGIGRTTLWRILQRNIE